MISLGIQPNTGSLPTHGAVGMDIGLRPLLYSVPCTRIDAVKCSLTLVLNSLCQPAVGLTAGAE